MTEGVWREVGDVERSGGDVKRVVRGIEEQGDFFFFESFY